MSLITEQQVISSDKKIMMVIADGLGGLPKTPLGPTELEAAKTPNMDKLATEGTLGLLDPIGPGITPGSGPAHLALFGYEPISNNVGRGLLSALGGDFDLRDSDVCARGNFATYDDKENVIDRRAGRVPTAITEPLCEKLEKEIDLGDVQVFVRVEKDHRFLLVLRGEHLSAHLQDTDPQRTDVPVLKCQPLREEAARTARLVDEFAVQARNILGDQDAANGVLLRGFASMLPVSSMGDRFGIRCAALADYPMYRGLSQLVGMEVISKEAKIEDRFRAVAKHRDEYDFFYIHFKKPDATGEDGDFEGKVAALEELDAAIPVIMESKPDVLIITGDHSTPATMAGHSWHPVPVLLWGNNVRTDDTTTFGEKQAVHGGMGRFPMMHLLPYALAHADKLAKFGA